MTLGFAPWAMFVGWVVYFTRPTSARDGTASWLCLLFGLVSDTIAVFAPSHLRPFALRRSSTTCWHR
ncbi:DUF1097 domain-containing protein [Phyllobacterium ifriqiyense]|uniref:DUF1097 domain-containing protein n=1 Tax=Phyllobacterium ifriqiyense TaxID=314238 RepID=UPI003393AC22